MLASPALAQPTVYSVDIVTDQLYTLDLATGDANSVGSGVVGFGKIEGLSSNLERGCFMDSTQRLTY